MPHLNKTIKRVAKTLEAAQNHSCLLEEDVHSKRVLEMLSLFEKISKSAEVFHPKMIEQDYEVLLEEVRMQRRSIEDLGNAIKVCRKEQIKELNKLEEQHLLQLNNLLELADEQMENEKHARGKVSRNLEETNCTNLPKIESLMEKISKLDEQCNEEREKNLSKENLTLKRQTKLEKELDTSLSGLRERLEVLGRERKLLIEKRDRERAEETELFLKFRQIDILEEKQRDDLKEWEIFKDRERQKMEVYHKPARYLQALYRGWKGRQSVSQIKKKLKKNKKKK